MDTTAPTATLAGTILTAKSVRADNGVRTKPELSRLSQNYDRTKLTKPEQREN